MRTNHLETIIKGLEQTLEGIRGLASIGTEDPATEEKMEVIKEVVKKVTIEDVRAVLAVKTRDGKTQKVKALLNEFGADKLSSVPEDKLADLIAKAEVL